MSFNLWHGGDAGGQPRERLAAAIVASGADAAGLQETRGVGGDDAGAWLAERLGWRYVDQGGGCGILSRFPIAALTPDRRAARLALPSGAALWLANVHLNHCPYQPYQLLGIPYGDGAFLTSPAEAVAAAEAARGAEVSALLASVDGLGPIALTGDFNEPSHRDWTDAAVRAGLCPCAVAWPSTGAVEAAGFVDALRRVHPDPVADPRHTWTPTTRADDPSDHHDRIDFVFVRGAAVEAAWVIGEAHVAPWPSDHRAVVAQLRL